MKCINGYPLPLVSKNLFIFIKSLLFISLILESFNFLNYKRRFMKKLLFCFSILLTLQSCWYGLGDDDDNFNSSSYEPITQSRQDFEKSISLMGERPIINSGKIYVKDDLIYLNELGEGFHIIDNSDPSNPQPVAFIKIPLATDLAIRNNILYVHHAVDLVAFKYSLNSNALNIVHRERNVFPELRSPEGLEPSFYNVPENEIVIGYQQLN